MYRPDLLAFLLPLLAAPAFAAETLDCGKIRADGHTFDLSKLGGPHSVVTTRYRPNPPEHYNTTYTLDICKPLKKSGGKKSPECPNGTRVCAITHLLKTDEDKKETDEVTNVVAIAGNLENAGGSRFEWTPTRLSTAESNSDKKKEGLRLVLMGGKDPLSGPSKERTDQKAIVEFLCDPEKEGTEGEWVSEEKYEKRADEKKDDDKKEDDDKDEGESTLEHQLKHDNASLVWDGFESEKSARILRLTWYTKYACEKREENGGGGSDDDGESTSSHWGFFTWFTVIAFLLIAGYLIFSSWINFTRYGARGWDLLPHSDTIRDIPYLLKDWIRRVLNTVQGTGSRGGYSAV